MPQDNSGSTVLHSDKKNLAILYNIESFGLPKMDISTEVWEVMLFARVSHLRQYVCACLVVNLIPFASIGDPFIGFRDVTSCVPIPGAGISAYTGYKVMPS